MQSIQFFRDALCKVEGLTADLLTAEGVAKFQRDKAALETQWAEARYLKVPVVGVFSAGKSSFLNVFTQKPGLLPVDTMPETAVAYELYYDTTERIELYREGQRIDSRPLAEIKALDTAPGDVAKVYCDSPVVQGLQERGIILVDMPGIGSGIERHDAAIYHYVQSGTAFVLMVDVDQGALRTSTLVFLQELKLFHKFPAVFLTKTDKKPADEVKKVADYLAYQLKQVSDATPTVGTVCSVDQDTEAFAEHLAGLDPNALLRERFGAQVRAVVEGVKQELSTRISVRQQDIADIDGVIAAIEAEIAKAKEQLPDAEGQADTPEKSTQDVLDSIDQALRAKVSTLAQMMVRGESSEDIKSVVASTIRTTLLTSLEEEAYQYADAAGQAVQASAHSIAGIKPNFIAGFEQVVDVLKNVLAMLPVGGIWAKALTLILTNLPQIKTILSWLFGTSESDRLAEATAKITEQIPSIVEALREQVYTMVSDNQKRIQLSMQEAYITQMNNVLAGYTEKKADAEKTKEKVQQEIDTLQTTIEALGTLSATL